MKINFLFFFFFSPLFTAGAGEPKHQPPTNSGPGKWDVGGILRPWGCRKLSRRRGRAVCGEPGAGGEGREGETFPFAARKKKKNAFDVEVGAGKINMSRLSQEPRCKPGLLFTIFSPLTARKMTALKQRARCAEQFGTEKKKKRLGAKGGVGGASPANFGVPRVWGEPKSRLP